MSDRRQRCRHCPARCAYLRPRGLCQRCYLRPSIRRLYPTRRNQNSDADRGSGDVCGNRPAPGRKTRAQPGTPDKIAILAARAGRKQALWHPRDAQVADGEGLAVRRKGNAEHVQVLGPVRLQGQPRPQRRA